MALQKGPGTSGVIIMEEEKKITNKTDMVGGAGHGCAGCEHITKSHFICIALAIHEGQKKKRQPVANTEASVEQILWQ